jgi:hypothetical protein
MVMAENGWGEGGMDRGAELSGQAEKRDVRMNRGFYPLFGHFGENCLRWVLVAVFG